MYPLAEMILVVGAIAQMKRDVNKEDIVVEESIFLAIALRKFTSEIKELKDMS